MKKKKNTSRREMSGIMDWFLPRKWRPFFFEVAPPGTGPGPETRLPALPAPKGGEIVERPEQPPSIIEYARLPAPPSEPSRALAWFGVFPPMAEMPPSRPPAMYAPPGPPAPAEAPQQALWSVFEPPTEPEPPMTEMFVSVRPEEQQEEVAPPRWTPVGMYRGALPWQSIWPFPTREQLAQSIRRSIDLPEVFGRLEAMRETPEFWRSLEANYNFGQPLMIPAAPIVYRELYSDLSRFFGIPYEVFDLYMSDYRTPQEEAIAFERMSREVIAPLILAVEETFESLKPRTLPGWFTIALDSRDPSNPEYWLYYVETLIPPARPGLTYGGPPGA